MSKNSAAGDENEKNKMKEKLNLQRKRLREQADLIGKYLMLAGDPYGISRKNNDGSWLPPTPTNPKNADLFNLLRYIGVFLSNLEGPYKIKEENVNNKTPNTAATEVVASSDNAFGLQHIGNDLDFTIFGIELNFKASNLKISTDEELCEEYEKLIRNVDTIFSNFQPSLKHKDPLTEEEMISTHEKNQYTILKNHLLGLRDSIIIVIENDKQLKFDFNETNTHLNNLTSPTAENARLNSTNVYYQSINLELVKLFDKLESFAKDNRINLQSAKEKSYNEMNEILAEITPSYTPKRIPDPIENAKKVVNEYQSKTANPTHPIQSEILKKMRDSVLGPNQEHSMRDIMKNLIANKYEGDTDESLRSRVKISLRSMFQRSKNHPEIRVLKLISEFKEGNQPADHRHNHQILQQIAELVKEKNGFTARSSTSANAAQFLVQIQEFTDLSKNHDATFSDLTKLKDNLNQFTENKLHKAECKQATFSPRPNQ